MVKLTETQDPTRNKIVTTITIDPEIKEFLSKQAKKVNRTKSNYIEYLLMKEKEKDENAMPTLP